MKFQSPWQQNSFGQFILVIRRLMRPFGNLEYFLIEKLTLAQNQRVIQYLKNNPASSLLLILPRCVKKTGCRADVQNGLEECLHCNQCVLGDVALLCESYGIDALVAFRSHIAFEMARTRNPDLIIATACHDRLIKALRAVPDCPALLAPLPPMPLVCRNAGVDLQWLDKQLSLVCRPETTVPAEPMLIHSNLPKARAAKNS